MNRDEDGKGVRLYDVRTVERNIRKGLTNRKDYDKYLKALPDVAEKAAPADLASAAADDDFLDDEDDDFDDEDDEDEPETVSEDSGPSNGTPSA